MGKSYLDSFKEWLTRKGTNPERTSNAANALVFFLHHAALNTEAEPLCRLSLQMDEERFGQNHPETAIRLNNLAQLLQDTNRMNEAESLMRKALQIDQQCLGKITLTYPEISII